MCKSGFFCCPFWLQFTECELCHAFFLHNRPPWSDKMAGYFWVRPHKENQTCDTMGAVSSLRCSNNHTPLRGEQQATIYYDRLRCGK